MSEQIALFCGCVPIWDIKSLSPGNFPLRKHEEAARQQGGLFFRENSSNGGKAIRTFWRNTKFGKIRCQGQNSLPVSHYLGVSYGGYSIDNSHLHFRYAFAFSDHITNQKAIKSAA